MEAHQGTASGQSTSYGAAKQVNCAASQCTSCKTVSFFKRELFYIVYLYLKLKQKYEIEMLLPETHLFIMFVDSQKLAI